MMAWSNDTWLSNMHRVANPAPGAGAAARRLSFAYFCNPNDDLLIECLPTCQSVDNPPKYPPIKFGDYALWFAAQRYKHMQDVKVPSEAEIAPGPRATEAWKS